jgi:uncharacterized RDD family membrane protein YckC
MNYAGFWIRSAAAIVDLLFLIILSFLLFFLEETYRVLVQALLGFFYEVIFIGSSWQATPGKRIFKLRVVNVDFTQISYTKSAARYFSKFLSSVIFFIGFLVVFFSEKKQSLHDKLVDSVVIKKRHTDIENIELSEQEKNNLSSDSPPNHGQWVMAGFDISGHIIRFSFSTTDNRLFNGIGICIGRSDDGSNHLVLTDVSVSRNHARLLMKNNNLMLQDLYSKNGTFVGDIKIDPEKEIRISGDDEIRFGETVFSIGKDK